jgi:hypothetical protein
MGPRMDARVEAALHYHGILLAIKASFGDTELMFYVLTRSIMTEVGPFTTMLRHRFLQERPRLM